MKVYCNTCDTEIDDDNLIAQFSASDPGCPFCGNNDFTDIDNDGDEQPVYPVKGGE